MTTPREPDLFEAKAREALHAMGMRDVDNDADVAIIAAALRKAESSALERAAQEIDAAHRKVMGDEWTATYYRGALSDAARIVRALIPPAAAPAAEPDVCVGSEYIGGYLVPRYAPAADYDPITAPIPAGDMNGPHGPLGKAQGAEAPDIGYDADSDRFVRESVYLAAQKRIAELEAALREAQGQLCAEHCEWTGTGEHDDQCVRLSKALAASAAPPEEAT